MSHAISRANGGLRAELSLFGGWLLVALVLWMLIAGRWGSYVGIPANQFYISELVLAPVCILSLLVFRREDWKGVLLPVGFAIPLFGLLAWAIMRTAWSLSLDVMTLRDFAPYGYIVVAGLAMTLKRPGGLRYTVLAGTVFHAAWVTPLLWDSAVYAAANPIGRTRVFELRTDFDALTAGVLACSCLLLASRSRRPLDRGLFVAAAAWSGLLVVLINNRAGFLATVAATSWTALHLYRRFSPRLARSVRRRLMAGTAALGVVLFGVVLIGTPAGQRLTETFDPDASTPSSATAGARLHVYQLVIDYVAESPGRVIGGVGMGPDFLTESGATPAYDPGETLGVRSPHNFALGTLARLGVVGAALHVAVVAIGYVLAGRLLSRPHVDELTALAALIVVAVPVAGLVGVVLESPFGAIPYYWGYGMLLAEMTRQRLDGDFSQTKSQQSHTVAARG